MSDMLSVAVSGLKAFQRALDTTSHNIANASTPGYSRQRVDLVTREPQALGSMNVGTGVNVGSLTRNHDTMLTAQMRTASSGYSRLSAFAEKAGALNNLFADSATGLSASLQKFGAALQGVANTPGSTAARQVLISEGQGLAERLKTYDRRLDEIDADIDSRLKGEAAAMSAAAETIARLNEQIVSRQASTGQAPNDLLDARDAAITELSAHVNVSVVTQDDGAANVFIGNGQALVLGSVPGKIVTLTDPFDPSRTALGFQSGTSTVDLKGLLSGGSVGGLLDFRREMLDPARNDLGQMAVGLASLVNAQHAEGMDLSGALGGAFFSVGRVETKPALVNGGSGTVDVTRTTPGALTDRDYVLQHVGGAWSLTRADTGAAVAMTGAGTGASPFVAEGLSIVVGGAPANGDRYLIQPTATAVSGLGVLVTDPARIAAAAPIRTAVGGGNTGTGRISAGEVLDATNPALRSGVTLQFTDATHYTINGAGNYLHTPGADIDVNGWRVQITGQPAAGDSFTVADNAGGIGDNRNALEMAGLLGRGVLSGGTESLNQASSRFIGAIGVAANQAQASRDAQQVIHEDAVAARDAVSGVNLDEEAANLLRYQQAYQAMAQVIRITQEMFDSLLGATGR